MTLLSRHFVQLKNFQKNVHQKKVEVRFQAKMSVTIEGVGTQPKEGLVDNRLVKARN